MASKEQLQLRLTYELAVQLSLFPDLVEPQVIVRLFPTPKEQKEQKEEQHESLRES